jgi:hypothetical protein
MPGRDTNPLVALSLSSCPETNSRRLRQPRVREVPFRIHLKLWLNVARADGQLRTRECPRPDMAKLYPPPWWFSG